MQTDYILQTAAVVEGDGSPFSGSTLSKLKQSDLEDLVMLEKLM